MVYHYITVILPWFHIVCIGVYPFIQYGIQTFVDDALNLIVYGDKYPASALDLKLVLFYWFEVNWLDDSSAGSNIHHAYDSNIFLTSNELFLKLASTQWFFPNLVFSVVFSYIVLTWLWLWSKWFPSLGNPT